MQCAEIECSAPDDVSVSARTGLLFRILVSSRDTNVDALAEAASGKQLIEPTTAIRVAWDSKNRLATSVTGAVIVGGDERHFHVIECRNRDASDDYVAAGGNSLPSWLTSGGDRGSTGDCRASAIFECKQNRNVPELCAVVGIRFR